jgi:hypothetical protein
MARSEGEIRVWLATNVEDVLHRAGKAVNGVINPAVPFGVLGLDSLARVDLAQSLGEWLGDDDYDDFLLEEHTTIEKVVGFLRGQGKVQG